MLVTGPLNDYGIVWIARRNRGVFEPEFRLVFMLAMLFGVFGYVGWAVGSARAMPWIGAVACITYVHPLSFLLPRPTSPMFPPGDACPHALTPRAGCSTSAWSCPARRR